MWYKTAGERHGETGEKGRAGEQLVIDYFTAKGFKVADKESDKRSQLSGVDLELVSADKTFFVDVKTNLNDKDTFAVEGGRRGWLFKGGRNDTIIHINTLRKKMVLYSKERMKEYLKPRGFPMSVNQLYWITPEALDSDFIKRIDLNGTSI